MYTQATKPLWSKKLLCYKMHQPGITRFRAHAMNVNLLCPRAECLTFFVLHRTKCKPMHSEWDCSQTINVLHKTKRERKREREGQGERARERLQNGLPDSTVHPSYCICQYFRFFKQTSSKTTLIVGERSHSECIGLHFVLCSTKKVGQS